MFLPPPFFVTFVFAIAIAFAFAFAAIVAIAGRMFGTGIGGIVRPMIAAEAELALVGAVWANLAGSVWGCARAVLVVRA